MPHSIGDVIRMAGHLLEHNPNTGSGFRIKEGRACFCFIGAINYSSDALGLENYSLFEAAIAAGFDPDLKFVRQWEGPGVTDEDRLKIAKRMQQYVG